MKHFFIVGLPRSRTAWMANWFTYGDSFCFHDGLAGISSKEDYAAKLQSKNASYVGDSDSGLVFLDLKYLYPDSPVVVIHRSIVKCQMSMKRAGIPGAEHFQFLNSLLEKMPGLHVNFSDIDKRIDEITDYCIGTTMDADRKEFLLNINMRIIQNKTGDSFLTEGI